MDEPGNDAAKGRYAEQHHGRIIPRAPFRYQRDKHAAPKGKEEARHISDQRRAAKAISQAYSESGGHVAWRHQPTNACEDEEHRWQQYQDFEHLVDQCCSPAALLHASKSVQLLRHKYHGIDSAIIWIGSIQD